jgi:MATE family multidrug resistance protein
MARRAALVGLGVGGLYAGAIATLFVAAAPLLVGVFASSLGGPGGEVARLGTRLVRLASVYILADAAHLVFAGALRGAGDTRWVMAISVVLHWGFASTAVFLVRGLRLPPATVFSVFVVFVVLLGVAMYARFRGGSWQRMRLVG